ncbi:MAG: DUF87 domain-containing protein, partial [Candidatus Aenigmatarchaeota archaeon]
DDQATWTYNGSYIVSGTPGTPTSGTCYVELHNFKCSDIGEDNWFKWQVVNGNPLHAWNSTPIQGPNLTESDVTVILIEGDGYGYNRSSGTNQVRRLAVNVYDDENSSYVSGANVSFWITNDSSSYRLEMLNQTNSLGNASYWFNPDCTHEVGQQDWVAGTIDSCYEDQNATATNYSLTVTGDLIPAFNSPNGAKYLRGEYTDGQNIPMVGNINDECQVDITNAFVNFSSTRNVTTNYCNPITNIGNGTYNCSLNTSGFEPQGWNVRFNVSTDSYNSNDTNETFSLNLRGFWVETKPVLDTDFVYYSYNSTSQQDDGGWGERWVFRVNATDEDNDTMVVKLWVNMSTGAWGQPNTTAMTNSSVQGENVTVTFTVYGWPSYSNPGLGHHAFKFNVSESSVDFAQNINETSNGTLTVEKDDVSFIHIEGANTSVNRSGSNKQHLSLRVYDTDKGNYPTSLFSAQLWATNDMSDNFVTVGTTFVGGYINTTSAQFDPGCTFAIGPQMWKGGTITPSQAYKLTNSSNYSINITTDPLLVNYFEPQGGKLYLKGLQNVTVRTNVTDDCGAVPGATLTFISQQLSASPQNKECVADQTPNGEVVYEGSGNYSCIFRNDTHDSDTWNYGYVNVTVQADKQYYNSSAMNLDTGSYYLSSEPMITIGAPYGASSNAWGDGWTFPVSNIVDPDMAGEIGSTINVSLWLNLTGDWESYGSKICVPSTGNCSGGLLYFDGINFMCNRTYSDVGTNYYKFNITDNFDYNDSDSSSFAITTDPTFALAASIEGDGDNVAREGTNSIYLAAKFSDELQTEINIEGVNATIWITENGTHFMNYTDIQSQADGYFNYSFEPDCQFTSEKQWWYIALNDSCYDVSYTADPDNQSANVIGQLKNFVLDPLESSQFQIGEMLNVTSNITSDCSENISSAVVTHEARPYGASNWVWANRTDGVDNSEFGNYNSTWNTSFLAGGNWSFRINASKADYYSNSTVFTNWTYLNNTPSIAENASVTPNVGGWGDNYTFTIDIEDAQYDNVTCKLFTYTNGAWTYRGSDIVYWGSGTCEVNVTNFTCSDINSTANWFTWEIDDTTPENIANITNVSAPYLTRDNVTINYTHGDGETVNRSGSQTQLLTVRIYDNTTEKYVGSGVPNATGRIFVTKDGLGFDLGTANTTNSSGYLNVYFDPASEYDVGLQNWTGGTYGDSCYYNMNMTQNYSLIVKGDLQNSIIDVLENAVQVGVNGTVTRYNNVTIIMNLYDDQPFAVVNATLNVTFKSLLYGNNFICPEVIEYGSGQYRCTLNSSDINAGWYNVSIGSNKTYYNDANSNDWHVLYIESIPELMAPSILSHNGSTIGGWGETWTAKVNVTEEDQNNATLYVFVKKFTDPDIPASWLQQNQTNYVDNPDMRGPVNKTITLKFSDPGSFQNERVVWQYKFRVNDTNNHGSETAPLNFTVDKDDISIEYISGNGEEVWRNGSATVSLIINVTDIDRGVTASGANVTIYVTTNSSNSSSFDNGVWTNAYTNGSVIYPFPPDCEYSTGEQDWYAKVSDPYYKTNSTNNYTVNIKTFIAMNISYPDGHSFLSESQVPFSARVFDECFNISGATVTFTGKKGASQYSCVPVTDQNNGTYNCSFTTSGRPFEWYDIIMTANKQYYGSYPVANTTTKYNAFFVATNPSVTGLNVNPSSDGWGSLYTFSVQLTDADQNWNNVSLWKSFDNSSWTLKNSSNITPTYGGYLVEFKNRFSCEDYLNATNGTNYYKINVSDMYNYTTESVVKNFTLDVNNITITIDTTNSNSTVRRMGSNSAYLNVIIEDTDYNVGSWRYPTGVNTTIMITRNRTYYDYNMSCDSVSGNCSVNYNPNCSSTADMQYWKAVSNDVCYQVIASQNRSLSVYGQLNVSIVNPQNATIVNRDRTTTFNATVIDDCISDINDSSISWYNSSLNTLATGYNTTWYVPLTYTLGQETVFSNSTKGYYDQDSKNKTIFVYGWSDLTYIGPANGTEYPSGENINIECRVIDTNASQPIPNYNVRFYKNNQSLGNETTNSTGYATAIWYTSGESAGWYNISCFIDDNNTLFYNASAYYKQTWLKLTRPLYITQIRMDGNICQQGVSCHSIYRNDTAGSPYMTNVTVYVKDANIGAAENASVSFYNSTSLLGNCATNSTGWCSLVDYNPHDSVTPNQYVIYINASRGENEDSATNSSIVTVKGIFNVTVASPPDTTNCGGGGLSCPKFNPINLTAIATTENGENITTINPTASWYNETTLIASGLSTLLPQGKVAEQNTGPHEYMILVSKSYFDSSQANVSLNITGLSNVFWISPTVETSYPDTIYPTCRVLDENLGSGIADYEVNFSYKWEPSTTFIYNGTHVSNSTGYASYAFVPEQKGNITFNCTIGDNLTQYYSANSPFDVDVGTFWVKDVDAPQIYSMTILPNDSIEANLNQTNITATVSDNYNIVSVKAMISMPNGTNINQTMNNITIPNASFGNYTAVYSVSYMPPIGGNYSVTIYAKDDVPESNVNTTYAGNFSVWGFINGSVSQCVNNTNDDNLTDCDYQITAPYISQTNNFTFEVRSNFTNLGPSGSYGVNLSHVESPSGSLIYSSQNKTCGIMLVNETCEWNFNVTVPAGTPPGLITTYVNATWKNPDNTIASIQNYTEINVDSNPILDIIETELVKNTPHDKNTYVGNVTVASFGNDEVQNIILSWYGLSGVQNHYNLALYCPLCSVSIVPSEETLLSAGFNFTSDINITVPAGQAPGNYIANLIASSSNAGNDTALLNITIPENKTWTRTPSSFGTVIAPKNTSAVIGNITVRNIGNIKIPFEVTKSGDNGYVRIEGVSWYSFDLEKQVQRNLSISYYVPDFVPDGLYNVTLLIRNVTAYPASQNVTFTLNVTDIPPMIADVLIDPVAFEQGYENVTIEANITDNYAVSQAWVNITPPNGTSFTILMNNPYNDSYNTTYVYPIAGVHQVMICANDTQTLMACTSPINITSSDTTQITIVPNVTIINATNITQNWGQSFAINFSTINVGGSRAFNISSNITYPNNTSAVPYHFVFGTLFRGEASYNETIISVFNATEPGLYYVNLTTNWTNLNNTNNSSVYMLPINVTYNPYIDVLEDEVSEVVRAGTPKTINITLLSIGNDNATNITLSCSSGVVCQNFTLDFSPQNISSMPIGNSTPVNLTFTVPPNYPNGNYNGTINISWSSNYSEPAFYRELPVSILIPANVSWIHDPMQIVKRVKDGTQGLFGQIEVINTGNANMTLNVTINGTIASYITLDNYNITSDYGNSTFIYINYSSPNITYDANYTGFITTNITGTMRENASIKEVSTAVTMFVTPYSVILLYPTQANPVLGVNPYDIIQAQVNITQNSTIINSNATFEVKIFNDTMSTTANISSYNFSAPQNVWLINFIAPNISLEKVYNLNITAHHNDTYYNVRSDIEYEAVVYEDMVAPVIDVDIPVRVPVNSTVAIGANITEPGGLKNMTATMKLPNNAMQNISMLLTSQATDLYTYSVNFSNTSQLGNYTFNMTACDLSGNCNSTSNDFEIYPIVIFSGYTKDIENILEPVIVVNFTFYDYNTTDVRSAFSSNSSSGYYNETIDAKVYDIVIGTSGPAFTNYIKLYNSNISVNYNNSVSFGKVPTVRTSNTVLKGFYVNNTLPSANATLVMDFSECLNSACGFPIIDPNHLGIYRYAGNWTTKVSSTDNSLFSRISNVDHVNSDKSVNLTTLKASVNVSNITGVYVLAEFICGDGECESGYGETTSNCPADCLYVPPTPVPPVSPSGGGGGGGGGAGAGVTTIIKGVGVDIVPLEIKSTLIETTLTPGEEKVFSTDITNNMDDDVTVSIVVEGPVFNLLTVQKPSFRLRGKTTEAVAIKAFAPLTAVPGVYTGDIVVTAGDVVHRTPVTITVRTVLEPLMDVQVKVLNKIVNPGTNLSFETTLLNMGETAEIEDITVTYNIRPLNNQSIIITTSTETLAVENVLTFRRTIEIPEDTPEDKYILDTNVSYWYGNKYASSADDFEVTKLPWILILLRSVFLNWITYVVLLGGVPSIIIGLRWYAAYKASKTAKARYIAPLDFKALPQAGVDSLLVGKIAETDVKSYMPIPQLLMHSIAAGGTGSGKTVSAMVCAEELLKRKVPIIVFDPTAQWTGFMKPNTLKPMLSLYSKFGLKPTDATRFKTNVILVEDADMEIDIKKYMKPGEITVFVMNRLSATDNDKLVRRSIQAIFDMRPPESKEIKLLLVYDEVHRLLPKYGGKKGYIAIERACREFRKWGIGIFMISQVLLDFKGAIRANIANEIQLRTKYEGDIGRVKSKYGSDYASKVTRLTIGTGLFQNPEFNHGRPWFVNFRPLLHSPFALTDAEVDTYMKLDKKVKSIEEKIAKLKAQKVDTYDIEIELNITRDKVKTAAFKMAETYLDSLEKRLERMVK